MPIYATGEISGSSDDTVRFGADVEVVGGNLYVSGSIIAGGNADTDICAVFNELGVDSDFRIESDVETHMFFVDAGNNRISIGDSVDAPAATLEITNHASAGAFGVPLLQLNSNDVDKNALEINAANTTTDIIDITGSALTSGAALNIYSDSDSGTQRALVNIHNENSDADATTLLRVYNRSVPTGGWDATALIQVSGAANTDVLRLSDVAHGASNYPKLGFYRDTKAISDDMKLGEISFTGRDSSHTAVAEYASIEAYTSDITNGDEAGKLVFNVFAAGTAGTAASKELLTIGGEDVANSTQCEVIVNEAGIDCDFRVESDGETHMIFVEGSSNRVSIGDSTDAPAATLEITNHASAGATGSPLLQLNSNDVDQVALDINAANTTQTVIDITADAVEDAYLIHMSADGLTTGGALFIDDDSSNTGTRSTVDIRQNHASALNATAFNIISDGGVTGMKLDKNFTDVAAATVRGLWIDFDRTVPGSGTGAFTDIGIDLDVNTAGLGVTITTGMDIDVVGATTGTHIATGLAVTVGSADTNYAGLFQGGNSGFGCADPVSLLEVRGGTGTGATGAGVLTLSTAETSIAWSDVLGILNFQAPKEGDGTDAITVAAAIEAHAETAFDASSNYTSLVFKLGESGAAAEKMKLESDATLNVGTTSTTGGLEVMNKGAFRRSSGRYYLEEFFVKRPQLNATIDGYWLNEPSRAANENFEITGRTDGSYSLYDSNVYWPSISGSSENAGLAFGTMGETGDQMIIQPHQDVAYTSTNYGFQPDQPMTAWSGISWNTSKSVEWECAITSGDVSAYGFWAGLGQSNPGNATWAYATDAHQAFFFSCADDTFGAITTNANMHFIYSVNGTDYITNLGLAMADNTLYRLRISINSSRQIKIFVNDTWYAISRTHTGTTAGGVTESSHYTSVALTADTHLIPYVGIQSLGGAYPQHYIHYNKISRLIGFS
jgi:hypothetical protein